MTPGQYSLYIRKTGDLWKSYGTFEYGKDVARILLELLPEPQDYKIYFGSTYSYDYSYANSSLTLEAAWCWHQMTFKMEDLKKKRKCSECGCTNYKEKK